ncbi:hypothetical protein AVEN_56715-1, partial [Araneus ventricosus]
IIPFKKGIKARTKLKFCWIDRGGAVARPPRSLNLKSLNFYPCGYLKSKVYEKPVTSCMDLVSRVKEAAACVPDTPAHFEQVRESMRLRCEACIVASG